MWVNHIFYKHVIMEICSQIKIYLWETIEQD